MVTDHKAALLRLLGGRSDHGLDPTKIYGLLDGVREVIRAREVVVALASKHKALVDGYMAMLDRLP